MRRAASSSCHQDPSVIIYDASYIESSRLQLPDPATQFPFQLSPLLPAYLVSPNFANFEFTSASVEVTARKEGRKEGKKRSARDELERERERERKFDHPRRSNLFDD